MVEVYDALIVGAGPAGSTTAAILARQGWRVLLVEKHVWPRAKVCGGCLSPHAVTLLEQLDLSNVLRDAVSLESTQMHLGSSSATVRSGGVAIARERLDAALVNTAVARGVTFISNASVRLQPRVAREPARRLSRNCKPVDESHEDHRAVTITSACETFEVSARVVFACDGINGTLLADEPWAKWTISPRSHIGVSLTLNREQSVRPNQIQMHIARDGYVGIARYGDGGVHVASALSPLAAKRAGGPRAAMQLILRESGSGVDLADVRLLGCGLLTRRRIVLGSDRVLAIGDACGYVEPFTGEGIAWALRGALEVTQLLRDGWDDALPAVWTRRHREIIGKLQRRCRVLRLGLRSPLLVQAGIGIARHWPQLAERFAPPRELIAVTA